MEFLEEILKSFNIPTWIIKNQDIAFLNNKFNDEFNSHKEVDKSILAELSIDTNVGYFESVNINNKTYNKIVIPLDNYGTKLGMLVEIKGKCENYSCMFKMLIDSIPEIIFCKDTNLRYNVINQECKDFYEVRGISNIIGKTDLDLPLDREFLETCTKHDQIVLKDIKPLYIEETVPSPSGNEIFIYQTIKTPIIDKRGNIKGILGSVRDVTEQKRIEAKLRDLSYKDILTGLYNRTYFDEKISELLQKEEFQVGVILGDLNGLKNVNDTYGHLKGDEFIKCSAKILEKLCNKQGIAFRWGGDEFAVLLIGATEKECKTYIECVHEECKNSHNEDFKVSISLGYSIFSNNNNNIDDVLKKADMQLYINKKIYKNIHNNDRITLGKIINTSKIKEKSDEKQIKYRMKYAVKLGEAIGLSYKEIERLRLIAWIHDVGNLGIDETILLKPNKLTPKEYTIIQKHVEIGYEMIKQLPQVSHIADEVLYHHERWDGKGYPKGLKGKEIPRLSRIISIVDAFVVMTQGSIYKEAVTKEEATIELRKNAGTQFDPDIIDKIIHII